MIDPKNPYIGLSTKALQEMASELNARDERSVFAGIPKWHPRNEETPEEKAAREAKEAEEAAARKKKDEEEEEARKKAEEGEQESLPRSEVQRLRRIAKEHDEAEKKRKEADEKAKREKAREEGRFQDLINDAEKAKDEATAEKDKAVADLASFKFDTKVARIASQVGFLDSDDALSQADVKDLDKDADDKLIERTLVAILKKKPYLKNPRASSGNGGGGDNGTGLDEKGNKVAWTLDEIKAMSSSEINANWNKPGFQDSLKKSGT